MHPLTTNKFLQTYDIHSFGFESAGALEIDGSKFKAVNNRDKNFTRGKMKRRLAEVEASIERYLGKLDQADRSAPPEDTRCLKDRIASLTGATTAARNYDPVKTVTSPLMSLTRRHRIIRRKVSSIARSSITS